MAAWTWFATNETNKRTTARESELLVVYGSLLLILVISERISAEHGIIAGMQMDRELILQGERDQRLKHSSIKMLSERDRIAG